MASKPATRSLQSIVQRATTTTRNHCSLCTSTSSRRTTALPSSIRQFASSVSRASSESTTQRYENEGSQTQEHEQRPRWSYTPERMRAPFSTRHRNPEMAWECNSDPAKLDRFYAKFLGRGGEAVLSDEIKWLAITHKSFDQGRRGFNDRLAFFGRRILNLQLNLALLQSPIATKTQLPPPNPNDKRVPFTHPALESLSNLTDVSVSEVLTKKRLAGLAVQVGMHDIIRWKPRNPANLEASGIDVVLTSTLYAIVGAIALQKGGEVANHVARERILRPLGI